MSMRTPLRPSRGPKLGGLYDRLIGIAKDALPLSFLALMMAIIIVPIADQRETSFILDKHKVEFAGERARMERPVYRGFDDQGRPFTLSADRAIQKNSLNPSLVLTHPQATLGTADGVAVLTADEGQFNLNTQRLFVSGAILLKREDGYRLNGQDVLIDLSQKEAFSQNAISGTGPLGAFTAGGFHFDLDKSVAVFKNRAHIRIVQH